MPEVVSVEVAFALPSEQALVVVDIAVGATAADAIEQSGLQKRFPEHDFVAMQIGVWGRLVGPDYRVKDGDRVEIYRALQIDPREARRRLARAGRTMGQTLDEEQS
jgi:putative ubiquitin-RnfH superfamily antitoxin RatB of RatAB toxin-antitoxin module